MPDFVQLLHSIGLNESEAKVYLTNLEIGSAPAQVLVKRSGFSRPATYDAIDQLMQKGLITATHAHNTIQHGKVRTSPPPLIS